MNKIGTFLLLVLIPSSVWAISFTPFGPNGEGGSVNGQVFTLGLGGQVFELDAFVKMQVWT